MTLVTGGMGGLGSIACMICATEGMGPVMTTSRTGALPSGQAQLAMLEGVMAYTPHISLKCDMSNSNAVSDVLMWCQKMGKTEANMQQQVVNISDITSTLKYHMSFTEKRKASLSSTLELMTWIQERYVKALEALKKKSAGDAGMSKKEMEDMMLDLQESEKKVEASLKEIKTKLNLAPGSPIPESSLKQIRQKSAQLSTYVADVEEWAAPRPDPRNALEQDLLANVSELQVKHSEDSQSVQWIVVGGSGSGGVRAQLAPESGASDCGGRLATGARLEQIAMQDDKVLFKKLEGDGPQFGWVSLRHEGVPLMVQVEETELE